MKNKPEIVEYCYYCGKETETIKIAGGDCGICGYSKVTPEYLKSKGGKMGLTKEQADTAYRQGKPIMTDAEYDKVFGINASDMDSPMVIEKKVKHQRFMHSLKKIKTANDNGEVVLSDVKDWYISVGEPVLVGSWKYDGLAVELIYKEGKLTIALTRGDGTYGEDITKNVLKMKNVLPKVKNNFTGRKLAEIVITHCDFKNYLDETNDKDPYDNPRNGASGAARSGDGRNAKYCTLMYYALEWETEFISDAEMFEVLEEFDYGHIESHEIVDWSDLETFYFRMADERDGTGFEVDGIVVSVEDPDLKEELGYFSNGRPKYKVALKFLQQSKETTLKDIEWQVGKTGHITPVGIIEPIDLGVTVKRVTLANVNKMKEKKIMIGDKLLVSRRGDVIPHVEKNLSALEHGDWTLLDGCNFPAYCPKCKNRTEIEGAFLICNNIICEGRELGTLEKWISTMKKHFRIHCIGPERLREMYESEFIEDVADLYRLNVNDLVEELDRCQEKSAENMLTFQSYKQIPLHIYLGGLNIAGIGSSVWENLINNSPYNTLEKLMNLQGWMDIYQRNIEGIGENRAIAMYEGLKVKEPVIKELISLNVTAFIPEKAFKDSPITGKAFVITGSLSKGRDEFEGIIKKNGGVIKGSVSKKVDYLLAGANVGKTKTNKAEACGTKVISEKEFWELMG